MTHICLLLRIHCTRWPATNCRGASIWSRRNLNSCISDDAKRAYFCDPLQLIEMALPADVPPPSPPPPQRPEDADRGAGTTAAEEEVAALAGQDSLAGYDVDVSEEGAVIQDLLRCIADQQPP